MAEEVGLTSPPMPLRMRAASMAVRGAIDYRRRPGVREDLARRALAKINRGDVFWIGPDDPRGPVPGYPHPHVVVQEDVFNHSRVTTVVVCALTSNLRRAKEPGNVLLEDREGNLPKRSVVVVSQVSSVEKASLGERIGSLSDARVEQILAGLRFQQRSYFGW